MTKWGSVAKSITVMSVTTDLASICSGGSSMYDSTCLLKSEEEEIICDMSIKVRRIIFNLGSNMFTKRPRDISTQFPSSVSAVIRKH